jgi:hypothetical protein
MVTWMVAVWSIIIKHPVKRPTLYSVEIWEWNQKYWVPPQPGAAKIVKRFSAPFQLKTGKSEFHPDFRGT